MLKCVCAGAFDAIHEVERSLLYLLIDPTDVLTNNPKENQLNTGEECDRGNQGCEALW